MILIPVYEESQPFENFVCSCRRRQQMREETQQRILRHIMDDPLRSLWHHLGSPVMQDTGSKEEPSPFENVVCSCRRRQQTREETQQRILRHIMDDPLHCLWHHLDSPIMRDTRSKQESSQEKNNTSDVVQEEARKTSEVFVKESFNIQLKTTDFKPDEVSVKVKDRLLTIHAKHEEKDSGNFVYREMHRNFTIPPDVNPDTIIAEMSKDGLLIIKAEIANGTQEIKPAEEIKDEVAVDISSIQAEENSVNEETAVSEDTPTEQENAVNEKTVVSEDTPTEEETTVGA